MMDKTRNSTFCSDLNVRFAAPLSKDERQNCIKDFGPLNVQQQLSADGFKHLLKALAEQAPPRNTSGG